MCKMTAIVTLCGANQCFKVVRSSLIEIIKYLWANLSKIYQNFKILFKFAKINFFAYHSDLILLNLLLKENN